jgi:hypothetical protein
LPEVWRDISAAQRVSLALGFDERERKRDAEWYVEHPIATPATVPADSHQNEFPRMPVQSASQEHREKLSDSPFPFNAAVARSVNKEELRSNPAATRAAQQEWDKLRKVGCWDESKMREWDSVADEARRCGKKVHVGRVFEIVVEKGAELAFGDPARKFKGRVVYQGNMVKDENWDAAIFSDLSSAPSSMEAAKAVDAYGLFAGSVVQQGDAEQAYTQSKLGGIETWVRLPREQLPDKWKKDA